MGDKKKADTSLNPKQRSRREFLESAGTTAALASAVPVLGISTAQAQSDIESTAAKTRIQLTVNGSRHSVDVEDRWTLVEVLRDQLDLTGTKIGCDRSEWVLAL